MAPPQQPEGNGGITGVVGSEVCLCALLERQEGLEGQDCSIGTGRDWGEEEFRLVSTVFTRIVAAATINYSLVPVRLLFEGGSYYTFHIR